MGNILAFFGLQLFHQLCRRRPHDLHGAHRAEFLAAVALDTFSPVDDRFSVGHGDDSRRTDALTFSAADALLFVHPRTVGNQVVK